MRFRAEVQPVPKAAMMLQWTAWWMDEIGQGFERVDLIQIVWKGAEGLTTPPDKA